MCIEYFPPSLTPPHPPKKKEVKKDSHKPKMRHFPKLRISLRA